MGYFILTVLRWKSQHSTSSRIKLISHCSGPATVHPERNAGWRKAGTTLCFGHYAAATAAAKSLQLCPTLCDPIIRQPTRLPCPWDSPGRNTGVGRHFLLQCMKVKVKSLSYVWSSATPWIAGFQAPLSMGFSRQEYWSGVPLPSLKCLLLH